MNNIIRVFSGRTFGSKDIELIQWVRKTYPTLSISELAATICELLEWTTPAGRPRRLQCSAFLGKLGSEGILELPAKQASERVQIKDIFYGLYAMTIVNHFQKVAASARIPFLTINMNTPHLWP